MSFIRTNYAAMENIAKLVTAFASLVAAVAWPATFLIVAITFRKELKLAFGRVPILIDRVKKASLAGVAVELERVAKAEVEIGADQTGKVTARQIEAASRITIRTKDLDPQSLLAELDRLCLEYDSIRRTYPSGSERTRSMTSVVVKMRALAPSLVDFMDAYKSSGSAGSRLAAVTMMQMVPRIADLDWLHERFTSENPFVFYHAALALENAASFSDTQEKKKHLIEVARQALRKVTNFQGPPDKGTVEILEILISDLARRAN